MKNRIREFVVLFLFCGISFGCATSGNHLENNSSPTVKNGPPAASYPSSSEFNIPVVVNKEVEWFIRYFQTANRPHFEKWLARSTQYIPLMKKILGEHNLPTDLVYLAMIESGFNTKALSIRRAAGPWQFIQATGKRYGLKVDWWVDERRDPIKSTIAASEYLRDLYGMFGSWFLAAAGYNAGENKIKKAILRHGTEDFWELASFRYLRKETKQYIPKLIAAALISKNPEQYGFEDVPYQEPLQFDAVTVDSPVDLKKVASTLNISYEEIQSLNPELRRWCTPPNIETYQLKVPVGKGEEFTAKYEEVKPKNKTIFHAHLIRQGDTLYKIAKFYKTEIGPIMELNNISSARFLKPGQHLIIPVKASSSLPEKSTFHQT